MIPKQMQGLQFKCVAHRTDQTSKTGNQPNPSGHFKLFINPEVTVKKDTQSVLHDKMYPAFLSRLCQFSANVQTLSWLDLHTLCICGAFTQLLILFSSTHMTTRSHIHLNGVMASSLEIWGWMRLDGDCPTYRCYPSPQAGRGRGLPLCSLPVSPALSTLTGWHVPVYSHQLLCTVKPTHFCDCTVSTSVALLQFRSWIWTERWCSRLSCFAGC